MCKDDRWRDLPLCFDDFRKWLVSFSCYPGTVAVGGTSCQEDVRQDV